MTALQTIWFFLVGVLLVGYALLDGFDLGTGWWFLREKNSARRRMMLNAIGPVWDGNEVWLLTGGGALFAAFPFVYASVFSGMYLALILVLFGLILRATAIEFRGQVDSPRWRAVWDTAFGVGSLLPALLVGVALGNVIHGVELNPAGDYQGTFFDLLNPYSLLGGLLGLVMFIVHGGLFQLLKLPEDAAAPIKAGLFKWWKVYLALYILIGPATAIFANHMFVNFMRQPLLFFVPSFILGGIIMVWIYLRQNRHFMAFLANCVAIASLMLTVGVMMFPNLVIAKDKALNLTIYNSSSSQLTLTVMLVIALLGMPLVLGYNIWIYRKFAGKVDPGEFHY
jgi:cytochrome d ubiquinol oxidase subunit II